MIIVPLKLVLMNDDEILPSVKAKNTKSECECACAKLKKKVLRSLASADMRARSCFFANFPKEKTNSLGNII